MRADDAGTLLRQRHVVAVERMLPRCVSRMDSSAPASARSAGGVAGAVATAVERSPWHRRRLGGADRLAVRRDNVDLPVITEADLMDNLDAMVTDGRLGRQLCEDHLGRGAGHRLGEFQVVASGRSSGEQGVRVYGSDE